MSRDYDPIPDRYLDDNRKYKPPKALRRLWKKFPYESQLYAFQKVFGRDPRSDHELEAFAENYIIEVYNSGGEDPKMPGDPASHQGA